MRIRLNGLYRQIEDGATVGRLLDELGLRRDGIAVAVDQRVVPKSAHAETRLSEGADVEVIRAVGGG